jgi:hypothetical protein
VAVDALSFALAPGTITGAVGRSVDEVLRLVELEGLRIVVRALVARLVRAMSCRSGSASRMRFACR